MLKITLLILFCAISDYGISGQSNDEIQVSIKPIDATEIKKLKPVFSNSNFTSNETASQTQEASKNSNVTVSNVAALKPQTETVASSTITIKNEDSFTPNTRNIENTSANTLINQSSFKDVENVLEKDLNKSILIKPSVKPVPLSSTPIISQSITIAPIDSVPVPKPGKWILNQTGEICIIISMAVQFNISDVFKKDNQTIYKVFNLPDKNNMTKVSGSCGHLEQNITLQWNETANVTNNFVLHFIKNDTTKQYSLHHLELTLTEGNETSMFVHNATLFSIGLSNSYRCLKQQNFTLNSNKTVGYLMISDLQFQAFKEDKNVDFGEVKDCKLDTPDIVPIAVGCALAGLVIIVLIAYLIGRKRSQARGYLSM
ncbi:lysosome-associated membrane glycoprotein 1 [Vespa velutina]|uniref:lysosome-associated membrane glycoprotein 1 n=1 Tax=Vespa velutina TaxID=202808 RepID=UPI001FB2CDA5|nr:lysosome-associated membrane glycoprotein 1 [Vespa velutina]XP_047371386.1 lysosome-associated membrane glycoprotein 1 [Vespa velutina]